MNSEQMASLIVLDTAGAMTDGGNYLEMVSFEIHPQRINVRNRINGESISSIAR